MPTLEGREEPYIIAHNEGRRLYGYIYPSSNDTSLDGSSTIALVAEQNGLNAEEVIKKLKDGVKFKFSYRPTAISKQKHP